MTTLSAIVDFASKQLCAGVSTASNLDCTGHGNRFLPARTGPLELHNTFFYALMKSCNGKTGITG